MNRMTAAGLLAEALDGRAVVVATSALGRRRALDEFANAVERAGDRVLRVSKRSGYERIDCDGGGRVLFRTRAGRRGASADIVFVDDEIRDTVDPAEIAAVSASRPGGEVVWP